MTKIKYLEMFAGVGGFRTGLTNAGDFFMPVGWCEIDKYAQKAYRALYGTEGEYFCEDARQIRTDELPEINLICAGFPCQPFSIAGLRKGFKDRDGNLFFEITRIIEKKRPKVVFLENVPNLMEHDEGKTFLVIYNSLAKCYAATIEEIQEITGKTYDSISIVGGGANAEYLNELTAKYTGRTVYAGPTEATAIGNLMVQMMVEGELTDLAAARDCVFESFAVKTYK